MKIKNKQLLQIINENINLYNELLRIKNSGKHWNINETTGEFLFEEIQKLKPKTIIEFGTSTGYSAFFSAAAVLETEGKIITFDSSKKRMNYAVETFMKNETFFNKITFVYGLIKNIQFKPETKIDFAFIDADKDENLMYFKKIEPYFTGKTVVVYDNFISHREKFNKLLQFIENRNNFHYTIINMDSGLLKIEEL